MTTIEIIKAVKDYGFIAVAVLAFGWMNNKANVTEAKLDTKIESIEKRLYDCYELRINDTFRTMTTRTSSLYDCHYPIVFIQPERIKIKTA